MSRFARVSRVVVLAAATVAVGLTGIQATTATAHQGRTVAAAAPQDTAVSTPVDNDGFSWG
jgi:hypothetical protein